jgi:hypothetical protein
MATVVASGFVKVPSSTSVSALASARSASFFVLKPLRVI